MEGRRVAIHIGSIYRAGGTRSIGDSDLTARTGVNDDGEEGLMLS